MDPRLLLAGEPARDPLAPGRRRRLPEGLKTQAPLRLAMSTRTPGPIVEDTATFFR